MPILPSSSISLLSDIWLPIPILRFIWVSAFCNDIRIIMYQELETAGKRNNVYAAGYLWKTFMSFAISGVRFICWFIPDFAASIVALLNNLIASITWLSFATWDLNSQCSQISCAINSNNSSWFDTGQSIPEICILQVILTVCHMIVWCPCKKRFVAVLFM